MFELVYQPYNELQCQWFWMCCMKTQKVIIIIFFLTQNGQKYRYRDGWSSSLLLSDFSWNSKISTSSVFYSHLLQSYFSIYSLKVSSLCLLAFLYCWFLTFFMALLNCSDEIWWSDYCFAPFWEAIWLCEKWWSCL